ncbi:LacI family DNA-binding transcriptional regulator [Candidatus Bipolaricaulota bacterium]|nr:LacI family DNA-binding transcriptional regulator [Candidatus Bipolaricaulota bacterium]
MKPTLEEVARLAGVSRSTVSRVINEHPSVSPETRQRVWKAIQQIGYRPHSVARSLATKRTRIIGVIIPEAITKIFSDQFFAILLQGAAQATNARGYQLILSLFDDPKRQEELYAKVLKNGYVEGAVVASAPPNDPLLRALKEDRLPTVSVGKQQGLPYVDVDNYGGGRLATEHLVQLGYRRIATITGPRDHVHVQERLAGYRDVLVEHGIGFEEELVAEGGFTEAGGMAAMQRLLPNRPEAVFVQGDTMAAGVLRALRAAGLRVPDDIALVSFDDAPLASLLDPPLTTVRQPIRLLGFMAVELLLNILEGAGGSHELVLPAELVVRGSCGAIRQNGGGR